NTGRIRDQWHTMTRTGLSPRLGQHLPQPFVEIHPDDAAQAGIADGGFARVATDLGQCVLKVVVSERQQRGMLFAPIHWSDETSSFARVGALVAPFTDPYSGQPENKATPAAVEAHHYAQRGFVLSRKPIVLPKGVWWARVAVSGGYGYLLAGNARPESWQDWIETTNDQLEFAEYFDLSQGIYRAATFAGERLDLCLFVEPSADTTDWDAARALFAEDALSDDQRRSLLSGKSMDGLANAGPIVCACFGVGRNTICDAIAAGAKSHIEIGVQLKAGTNCGSCIPELKRLLAQTPSNTMEQHALATAAS
ncbi:MAG TPA: molybdopterin dinucleotide binding domain-containing protein, partial [Afipia sp.]